MQVSPIVIVALSLTALPAFAQQADVRTPPPTAPRVTIEASPSPSAKARVSGRIYIGERAPDFELESAEGRAVRLSSLRGDWVLLIFADRKEQIRELRDAVPELRPLGVRVVAVCNEKAHGLATFATREALPFLTLADATGDISGLFGLFDDAHSQTRPGLFVLDRDGTVRMAMLGQQLPAAEVMRLTQYVVQGL